MRKILLLLCIIIAFSCISCYATEPTTITLKESIEGDKITVSVNISENSGASGGKLDIAYDNSVLNAISYNIGEILGGYTCFANLSFKDDVIRISWAGVNALTESGALCTIDFTPKSETAFSTDVDIEYSKLADTNGNPITVETSSCTITNGTPENTQSPTYSSSGGGGYKNTKDEESTQNTPVISFSDVKTTDWFYENVKYVVENKLMNGVSDEEFAPNDTLTRAMLVTVLYRNAGEPAVNKSIPFMDVDMNSYYANAVSWAKQNNIVNGITEIEFAPDMKITREQIATIMYRYAQHKGYDVSAGESTNILSYDDLESVSDYATSAMQYVVGSGLIKGKSETTLNPADNATRAETAAILQRFIENNK